MLDHFCCQLGSDLFEDLGSLGGIQCADQAGGVFLAEFLEDVGCVTGRRVDKCLPFLVALFEIVGDLVAIAARG